MAWRDDSRSLRREAERVIVDQFDGLMPVERRGRFRAYFWRASGEVPGQLMTQSVISGLPIDAMQKDHSITVFALAAGLKGPPQAGVRFGVSALRAKAIPRALDCGHRGLGVRQSNIHPYLFERSLYLGQNIPIGGTAHQAGTLRFGSDPAQSVLDLNCKAHLIDNLYVPDASFFPSIGAANPTLTIIKNAARRRPHRSSIRMMGINFKSSTNDQ
jgi:choline dehydrogenase-like flavoprotein